jgi:hypothetical protein
MLQGTKGIIMKLGKLSLSTAALLACGVAMASAQSTTPPAASSPQAKCWDAASGQIKDKMAMNSPGASGSAATKNSAQANSTTASGAKAPGGVTTGSGAAGTGATTGGGLTGSATARPPQAAGLPNC